MTLSDYDLARSKLNDPRLPHAHLMVCIDPDGSKPDRWTCSLFAGEIISRSADKASAATEAALGALRDWQYTLREVKAAGELG